MRILVVSHYPPARDGIAQYAVQEVKALRAEGHNVEVLSPEPSAAHHHLDLRSRRGPWALAKRARSYDRVIVQFHPAMFYNVPITPSERTRVALGLLAAFRLGREVEVRVHEFDVAGAHGGSVDARLTRAMWRSVDRISVHTEAERRDFAEAYELPVTRIDVVEHGATFVRRAHASRAEARHRLGLPEDAFVFLSPGFVQPHKGFDRAVRAFGRLGARRCRLEIVGSVRVDDPEYLRYAEELRHLVAATPGVTLHEQYVSDEEFDLWIVACDTLVLPYRMTWSSGVCARAALYGRPVIATRVGGLEQQAPDGTVLVDDDLELAAAMQRAAGEHQASPEPWPVDGRVDRDRVEAEIRRRAALRRAVTPTDRGESPRELLRRLPHLALPRPVSNRPGVTALKRLVNRLTSWQLEPVVHHLNAVQRAVIDAIDPREEMHEPPAAP